MQTIVEVKAAIVDWTQQIDRGDQIRHSAELQYCQSLLQQIDRPVRRIEHFSEETIIILKDNEREKILDWVSQIPYVQHYQATQKKALRGTGQWLFSHPSFLQWKQTSSSEILWLHGMSGSGKSTLLYVRMSAVPTKS